VHYGTRGRYGRIHRSFAGFSIYIILIRTRRRRDSTTRGSARGFVFTWCYDRRAAGMVWLGKAPGATRRMSSIGAVSRYSHGPRVAGSRLDTHAYLARGCETGPSAVGTKFDLCDVIKT